MRAGDTAKCPPLLTSKKRLEVNLRRSGAYGRRKWWSSVGRSSLRFQSKAKDSRAKPPQTERKEECQHGIFDIEINFSSGIANSASSFLCFFMQTAQFSDECTTCSVVRDRYHTHNRVNVACKVSIQDTGGGTTGHSRHKSPQLFTIVHVHV